MRRKRTGGKKKREGRGQPRKKGKKESD